LNRYKYSFRRTNVANALASPVTRFALTLLLFVVLVVLGGYFSKLLGLYEYSSFLALDLEHLAFGLVAVGFSSLLTMLRPFHLHMLPSRGTGDRSSIEGIFFLVLVAVGAIKGFYSLYKLVAKLSQSALAKAEYMVENVAV